MADDKIIHLDRGKSWTDPETLKLKIATSSGHQGRVTNKSLRWPELCKRLENTARDSVTMEDYLSHSVAWQDKRKNTGYFVGGQFAHGVRKIGAISERCLLTFDVDSPDLDLTAELKLGIGWIADCEYFVYSTRKHTPDNPRLRVVIPLNRPVPVTQYAPLSRIVAHHLDDSMKAVDPVSFRPAQIMYWPSTCLDAEFVGVRHGGRLLDPGRILSDWGDWTDYSKLPRSPRERDLRQAGDKATDPTTKRGIVGAFCRAYNVHAVIEKFLPGIYELGEGSEDGMERYSYVPGSTTNGAVVYEAGRFLYSHHGTDPCADRLVNSWDLARIHLHGGLDPAADEDGAEEASGPTDLPSYKALVKTLANDPLVGGQLRDDNYDFDAIFADAEDDGEPRELTEENWRDELDITEKGIVKSTLHNIALILTYDDRFRKRLAYNEFLSEPVLVRPIRSKTFSIDSGPIRNVVNGDLMAGRAEVAIRRVLEAPRVKGKPGWGLKVTDRDLRDAMAGVADDNPFNPVQQYLASCRWDGVPRISGLWIDYFGAADTPYHRETARLFMAAAVARAYEPGCKWDFVPILEGRQGMLKSTAIRILAGAQRFGELSTHFDDKAKLVEQIQGKWMVEIPELVQFRKAEAEVMKAMFSAQSDRVRLAWGRGAKDYLRQTVFVGTTNQREYLKDPTGNRRYWPIRLSADAIDLEGLTRDRDILWAEARETYRFLRRQVRDKRADLPLYLDGETLREAEAAQADRMVGDTEDLMTGQLVEWLDTPVPADQARCGWRGDVIEAGEAGELVRRTVTCVKDITFHLLGRPDSENDARLSHQVATALARLPGWRKARDRVRLGKPLGQQRVYVRDE